ncbi:MAG: universal stress protein, partial [Gemmatimonadota bacterium]
TYTGARLVGGRDHWTALSYGAGLNARGALEIIIATVGLQVGILSQEMFSVIVVMAMATSIMAPFALRATLKRVTPEQQEVERLRREELAEGSLVDQVDRVLLPVRYRESMAGTAQAIEAHLLERLAARRDLSITLLTVVPKGGRSQARAFLEELKASLFAETETALKVVEGKRVADAILNEAEKDYDLIILGAPEFPGRSEVVFNPLVDYVVRMAPCTTMVVRGGSVPEDWKMRRLLVPTNGSVAARRAAEMAFALTAPDRPDDEAGKEDGETGAEPGQAGADITILNVMVEGEDPHHVDAGGKLMERRMAIAREVVEEIRELGQGMGLSPTAEVRRGRDPETVIMDVAREMGKDLLVIGTDIRPGSDRLFLGPRVENLLLQASCPVVVVNTAR